MVVARNILLILHIISAGVWISGLVVSFITNRALKSAAGPAVGAINMFSGEVRGMMGQIGAIGILITGLGLIGVDKYGFLGLGGVTPTWLVIKQIIFIILLVVGGGIMTPLSIRLRKQMAAARAGGAPPADVQEIMARLTMIGYGVNLLVFINICLAVWKPM